jgi:SsrA-binding protein
MAKKKTAPGTIRNRRARFDYELGDSLLVGLVLNGRETKALRLGHGHLQGAYVAVKNDELWLINAAIHNAPGIALTEEETTQSRKLLAKRREINALIAEKKQGRTIVPLEVLTKGRYIKLRLAIGKGRKKYDKRQVLKARDEKQSIASAIKSLR